MDSRHMVLFPTFNGNLGGDVLPGGSVTPPLGSLTLSPHHTMASRPHSVWILRLKGGVSVPRGCSASLGTLSQCCLPEGWSQCSSRAGNSAVTVPPRRLTHGSTLRNSVSGKEGYVSHLLPVLWASVPCPLHHREHSTGPLPRTASFLSCAHSSLQGDFKPDSPFLCPHPLHGTITQAWLAGFCLPEGLGVGSWCSEPCSDPQLE